METLLPYYERELTFLRRLSHDFAKRHPKVAGRLLLSGETCDDPHIERLIESFAFLTGRLHKKLDDDFPELTDSLLGVIYPHYLRPFPSVSIAHFDSGDTAAQLTKTARIPRGTNLHTLPVRGVPCAFKTAFDVDITQLNIVKAAYENVFDTRGLRSDIGRSTSAVLRLDIESISETSSFNDLEVGTIRVFLNGDPSVVSTIREKIFTKATGLWISTHADGEKIELPLDAIKPVGFSADETLLEHDARVHLAYQLVYEYFVFPEKFNFIDIDLTSLKKKLSPHIRTIQLRIGLSSSKHPDSAGNLLDRITKDNFILGCSPVVNLFQQIPEPIRATGTQASYPVLVDNRRSKAYEIYSIDRVFRVRQTNDREEVDEFKALFSIHHATTQDAPLRYWHASQIDITENDNYTMEISLIDPTADPDADETHTLSMELTCTNRDLPSQLPFGLTDGDLFIDGGSLAKAIRFLRKPTPTYHFPKGRGAQWRLISHLSLNHLSLSGPSPDAIKEILTLYDITQSVSNSRQISGIVSIEHRPTTARMKGNPFPVFVRGLEIRICIDESHYAGIGLFMFTQILDHFFGLYVHTNSFTQLVVISKQTGQELVKCPPRNGESILA